MTIDYEKIKRDNIREYGEGRRHLELLGKLYTDRTHFIFELLQNAEDACERDKARGLNKRYYIKFHLLPDKLIVQHNGIPFDEHDVRGICGIASGTKSEDLTQIGKFGIGFKSVYAYTKTPQIYSGSEAFQVEYYVRPSAIDPIKIDKEITIFIFPFNQDNLKSGDAFNEISEALYKLGSRVLLFLQNIEELSWQVGSGTSGLYMREVQKISEFVRKVYVLSKVDQKATEEEEWLIFERPINGEVLKVEVAYRIKMDPKIKKLEIIPIQGSTLLAFFPTEKETHLKFIIQGPYRTTPSRDNIPKYDNWNKKLLKETALLVEDSISEIKKMGLLTVNFLNMLPLSRTEFHDEHMFREIFDSVVNKLKSHEQLLPSNNGSYISAKQALLARGKALIELLLPEQLSLLFNKEREDIHWLNSNITRDRTPELRDYLMSELSIHEITPEKFIGLFTEKFIEKQSDEWVVKFYNFLFDRRELWSDRYYYSEVSIRNKPFIRLEDNSHSPPFIGYDDKPIVYLPTDYDSSIKTVKKVIAQENSVKEFLKQLGLTEPGEIDEIVHIILPKYIAKEGIINVSYADNIIDIKKIFQVLKKFDIYKTFDIREQIKESFLLIGIQETTKKHYWCKPSDTFIIKTKDMELFYSDNPYVFFLQEMYIKEFQIKDLETLGCIVDILIRKKGERWSSYITICNQHGWHKRGLNGFDPDCEIVGLKHALDEITLDKAKVIWNILKNNLICIKGTVESSTRQDYSNSTTEEFYSEKVGKPLCERKWLPDRKGVFYKPSELTVSDLHQDLDVESREAKNLIEKLGFKQDPKKLEKNIEEKVMSILPAESRRRYELAQQLSIEELEEHVKEKERKKKEKEKDYSNLNYKKEFEESFNKKQIKPPGQNCIPPSFIPDPDSRREKVKEDIQESMDNEPPANERFKRVPVKKWKVKDNSARIFLGEQYGGKCQICGYTFSKRDGEPYFEGLYIVSRTKAEWIDRSGNVLCLCANCCAKFVHGEVDADDILKQINDFNSYNKGNNSPANIAIRLCGERVILKFSQRHILDLQEMFKLS